MLSLYSLLVAMALALGNAGSDPNERMEFFSGPVQAEWPKPSHDQQPSHFTYQRVHGGIGP